MDRTVGERRLGLALLALVTAAAFVSSALSPPAVATPAPERRLVAGDDSPFPLAAPWPAGQVWMAGNGGNFYGDGPHLSAEFYAVDFNRIDGGDEGQPIYAAAAGVVISAGWLEGYGNCVILAHRYGVTTTYGHFERPPSVKAGQHVTTATVLGYSGSTGNSTGPHLHFSVRAGGISLKPEPMEGRRLFDGIFIVAGPKPEAPGGATVLADLLRSPAPELSEAQWLAAAPEPVESGARGGSARVGRRGRPHSSQ